MFSDVHFRQALFTIFLLTSLCCFEKASAAQGNHSYFFDQQTKFGLRKVYLRDDGLLVVMPHEGVFMQYKTADKIVTMWSPQKHIYCTISYQKWMTEYRNIYAAASWYSEMTRAISSETVVKNRFKFHTYKFIVGAEVRDYYRTEIGQGKVSAASQQAYVTTIELPIFPEAASLLNHYSGLPQLSGIPYTVVKSKDYSLTTRKFDANATGSVPYFISTTEYKKMPFSSHLFTVKFDRNITDMVLPY